MQGNLLKLHEKLIGEADFPLPKLGPKLKAMRENLRSGRGFQLIRGVPVHDWSNRESVIAYFGIGLYLGKVNSQNRKGHLVGHIKVHQAAGRRQISVWSIQSCLMFFRWSLCDVSSPDVNA